MKCKPSEDGVTHINVYSNGKTSLGRFLSNFTEVKGLQTKHGIFRSVEGYWYYLGTNDPRKETLRNLYGFQAKKVGKQLRGEHQQEVPGFKEYILDAIRNKIKMSPNVQKAMINNNLPYVHYYVMQGKIIVPKEGQWIWDYVTEIAEKLKNNQEF